MDHHFSYLQLSSAQGSPKLPQVTAAVCSIIHLQGRGLAMSSLQVTVIVSLHFQEERFCLSRLCRAHQGGQPQLGDVFQAIGALNHSIETI